MSVAGGAAGETLSQGGRLPWGGLGAAEPPRCSAPVGSVVVTWTLPPTVTMADGGDFQREAFILAKIHARTFVPFWIFS